MTDITESELERLGFVGFQPGRGPQTAAHLEELAARGGPHAAQALVLAGEIWERIGDDARAEAAFRAAVADGGPAPLDARSALGGFLLERGRRDEAVGLFEAARAARPDDATVYEFTGEAFERVGELAEALRWFNTGYTRLEALGRGSFLRTGRWRVRRTLGYPRDDLDEADEAERAALRAGMERSSWALGRRDASILQTFVSAGDWEAWRARWPDSDMTMTSSYADHLAHIEAQLRQAPPTVDIACVPIDLPGLLTYAETRHHDPGDPAVQDDYAELLLDRGAGAAWPPGRNEPCWCGSGGKYKKCCAVRGR